MRKFITIVSVGVIVAAGIAFAQETDQNPSPQPEQKISFPIAELGVCASKAECKAYCDDPAHAEACISFAESHGLMKADEAKKARQFSKQAGPGGCMGSKCREYCSSPEHREECIQFAKEHGLKPPPSAHDADIPKGPDESKVESLLKEKNGPGGCKSVEECKNYCTTGERMKECLQFAKDNNLMSIEEVDRASKFIEKEGPGGCRGLECKAYCEGAEHREECFNFAVKNGLISEEQAAHMREMMQKMGPPQENEDLTPPDQEGELGAPSQPEDSSSSPPNDADMPRGKHLQQDFMHGRHFRGPGGCTSPEECAKFCSENGDKCKYLPPPPPRKEGSQGEGMMKDFMTPENIEKAKTFMEKNPQMRQIMEQKFLKPRDARAGERSVQENTFDLQNNEQDQYQQEFERQNQPQNQNQHNQWQQFGPSSGGPPPGEFGPPSGEFQGPPPGTGMIPPGNFGPPPGSTGPPPGAPPPSSGGEPPHANATSGFVAAVFSIIATLLH